MPHQQNNGDVPSLISSFQDLKYIAAGKSGIVYAIDRRRILKEYWEADAADVERRAFERLGSHPNIVQYLGSTEDGSIILERGQVLRSVYRGTGPAPIALHRKFRWLRDAAEGMRHMHNKDIVHADFGCHNLILTEKDCLKIIDFEGCSIDGQDATGCYEWCSYQGSAAVCKQTDIFAFGCMIYEIITGRVPCQEFETYSNRAHLVEQQYQNNKFPDVTDLPFGELMTSCWDGTFNSMSEIVQALEAASPLRARFMAVINHYLKSSCCLQ